MVPHTPFESPRRDVTRLLLVALALLVAAPAWARPSKPTGPTARGRQAQRCTPFVADCTKPTAPATTSAPAAAPLGASEMRIERDPETGGWTLARLAVPLGVGRVGDVELNQSQAGLHEVALAGGGVSVDLQGRFQSYSGVRRARDRSPQFGCTESSLSLFEWLKQEPVELDRFGRPVK
jgi:hypothetical protein